MSALSEIRTALAKTLSPLPEQISIALVGGKYDEQTERFAIRVLVGKASPKAEARLDELLAPAGEQSMCALLEADPTLGGAAGGILVRSHNGHHAYRSKEGVSPDLGSEITVEVHRLPER